MTAILSVGQITINSMNPRSLAEFYVNVFGGTLADYGNGYIGINNDNNQPGLLFQQADEPSPQPGWVHLDCVLLEQSRTPQGLDAAIEAITEAGGQFVEHRGDSNFAWTVMEDPEGNPFCISTGPAT